MDDETLALNGAPEEVTEIKDDPAPNEPEATDVVTEDEEGLKSEEDDTLSESSTDEQKKPKTDSVQKRIDELTRKRREAERNSEYWRDQAMKKEPVKSVETVEEPLKSLQDFDYDEGKYQQHLFDKARHGAVDEARRVLGEEQKKQTSNRKASDFRGREAEFSKSVDDYQDVARSRDLPISQVMADVVTEMESGPEVLYYLGKNPNLADEISQLSPLSTARELGRIEAKLQLQEKKGETVSKAPKPTPKIAASDPAITKNIDDMSQVEFNAMRRKQIAKRRG